MITGCRKNEAQFCDLPIEIQENKDISQMLAESERWIPAFQKPEIIQNLLAITQTIDENQMIHFHKKDIENILKKNKTLKNKEKFPFGMEYHKTSKTMYFVLKEKNSQIIAGKGYFVYVKILQNIHTKNFIARKTEIITPAQYESKLLETQKELRILSKAYGRKNISYGFRFTTRKGFFERLFGFHHHLPHKIDIFMPWIPGVELFDFINELQPGKKEELLCYKIMLATALELHRLHQLKIIHGDIKPENIKVCIENDEVISLQIFDFNLSLEATTIKNIDGHEVALAYTNILHGTPAYLDPRIRLQTGCIYSSKSDTFALLMILFEMLMRTKLSFMHPSSDFSKQKLHNIREKLMYLKFPSVDEAIFLSKYILKNDDPYPSLQSLLIFLKNKIQTLSKSLEKTKKPVKPLKNFRSDKLGLFGISTEKKAEESKHVNINFPIKGLVHEYHY